MATLHVPVQAAISSQRLHSSQTRESSSNARLKQRTGESLRSHGLALRSRPARRAAPLGPLLGLRTAQSRSGHRQRAPARAAAADGASSTAKRPVIILPVRAILLPVFSSLGAARDICPRTQTLWHVQCRSALREDMTIVALDLAHNNARQASSWTCTCPSYTSRRKQLSATLTCFTARAVLIHHRC